MKDLNNYSIAILATNGFEQVELTVPLEKFREAGATVHVVSPEQDSIKGWDEDHWGDTVPVDKGLSAANPGDYDALVLPGGQINPDILRTNGDAIKFIEAFAKADKPVAAICHAPWLLIEAGLAEGRMLTSFPSIRTDLRNAGANVVDQPAVTDRNVITSRNPDDLDAFCDTIADALTRTGGQAT
ncbi:type 1 glutamine amidotransferase domain-containing protein [Pontivivens nitratireducens]|uniref:Type 1 glutamine amidotransferase n=1 Tax=Pontivivens nitratireducens TaxID=2758038 RepID=A0A6G7VIJ8_9RHOB|nr:type 1 glutamine amidotransferase domain-containing protein [Pontibrevibacter nitratireducens]QIK39617.1 type 1 glutamine amidotransferase [Pontibrevibacter nitratireducens]